MTTFATNSNSLDDYSFQPLLLTTDKNKTPSFRVETSDDARRVLSTRPSGVRGSGFMLGGAAAAQHMVEKAQITNLIFPWQLPYKVWWYWTALCSIFTVFFAPFQIAFEDEPGTFMDVAGTVELLLNLIFAADIFVNFNLAIYDKQDQIVLDRPTIAQMYWQDKFWIDVAGVFPFETVALVLSGNLGSNSQTALLLSLLRTIRFVRLHRMKKMSFILQYNARVSLMTFTLLRNLAVVLMCAHMEACAMYFLARLHNFDDETWLGPLVADMTGLQRYTTAIYWSIVTFCTVGYGDFSPVNSQEQVVGCLFMLINIVVAAWIIGSITLLIVKGDEQTGEYRDSLETLHQYGEMHQFDAAFMSKLKRQLRLEHSNKEIADEQVLKHFPSAVRRKILRRLYLEPLLKTQLMTNVRQQFVDAFLMSCTVEIFSPGEEIVERGSILSDLFLLVGGIAEITTPDPQHCHPSANGTFSFDTTDTTTSINTHESATTNNQWLRPRKLEVGDFIGEIGFFTESPQVDSVSSLTVCKTLTMSRSAYKLLAQDHPGSVGKILHNLLAKVERMSLELHLPKRLTVLRVGSNFDVESGYGSLTESARQRVSLQDAANMEHRHRELTAIKDLVKMHMSKQLDDQTTRLLFAASRGDTRVISLMCDHGFDPNNADYDHRTALMVAAMKGNTDVCKLLLEYQANPNLTDMHGSSALLEAVKNGHEATMTLLTQYGAELGMPESRAASVLCQAVFDGDILLLKRLLQAGIDVNSADYDKRTAAHIAGAEGNVAAVKVLAEHGADMTRQDRWGNTVLDEAKRANAYQLLKYLKENQQLA